MEIEKTRHRGFTFKEMLKRLRECGRFHEFLRTAVDTGYLAFDVAFFSELSSDERKEIKVLAKKIAQLYDFDPLPIAHAFPRRFGPAVTKAISCFVPELDESKFFALIGDGRRAVVQARHFLTARKRHPRATPYFRDRGPDDKCPITFIEDSRPVALLMPLSI